MEQKAAATTERSSAVGPAHFHTRMRFAEMAAKRGDFQATCRRLFAAGVPSDQCYCAAKALILSVRSEA